MFQQTQLHISAMMSLLLDVCGSCTDQSLIAHPELQQRFNIVHKTADRNGSFEAKIQINTRGKKYNYKLWIKYRM